MSGGGETLVQALGRVHARLLAAAGDGTNPSRPAPAPRLVDEVAASDTLQQLQVLFALSDFERDLLVLCLGTAVEERFQAACATLHGEARATWPTFGLALAVLEQPHWSAISRARPLRYWNLLDPQGSACAQAPLLHAPLQIDERVMQFLLGVPAMDARLEAMVHVLPDTVSAWHTDNAPVNALLEQGLRHWAGEDNSSQPILICGERGASCVAAYAALCRRARLTPYVLDAVDLPSTPECRQLLARLWTRESALQGAALLIRGTGDEHAAALSAWLARIQAPVAVEAAVGSPAAQLSGLRLEVPGLSAEERRQAWVGQLGEVSKQLNGTLERLVDYFHFDVSSIQAAASSTLGALSTSGGQVAGVAWRACRQQARRALGSLARRIEPRADWSELVLPEAQTETLRQVAIHLRQRAVVDQQWGFAERYSLGHGLSALFTGGSGTGKTMAAESLARELDLDLYQIDLAGLVSKYIGETEKNLRRVFDAAEESGAILLFDECDALFGKRSEVRDSHDRYANLEVSYLLQRMDSYRGVAILTTNMRHALDSAFVRRIRFIVQFPFPDEASRARIWAGIFPPRAPLQALDFAQLARLNVSGGVIRNIATHAAFLAAEQGQPIQPCHVLAASRIEYAKMDKSLTAAETRGWA